ANRSSREFGWQNNEPPRRQGRQDKKEQREKSTIASRLPLFSIYFLFLHLASWRFISLWFRTLSPLPIAPELSVSPRERSRKSALTGWRGAGRIAWLPVSPQEKRLARRARLVRERRPRRGCRF